MTTKLTTSLFAIAAIAAAGLGFYSINPNQTDTPTEVSSQLTVPAGWLNNSASLELTESAIANDVADLFMCYSRDNPAACHSRYKPELDEEQIAMGWGFNFIVENDAQDDSEAEILIAFDRKFCETGKRGYKWATTIAGHTYCGLAQGTSEVDTQIALDTTGEKCRRGVPGETWEFNSLGWCVQYNTEELNAFEAEQLIAMNPERCERGERGVRWATTIGGHRWCTISWNGEELNAFEAEDLIAMNPERCERGERGVRWATTIGGHRWCTIAEEDQDGLGTRVAFDHTPCLRGNPKYRWGNGIFGKICVLQYNKEGVNAFEAEEQIAFDLTPCQQNKPGYRWGNGIFGRTCAYEGRNSEELNAFDAEELIAFDRRYCETGKRGYKWATTIAGHTYCGLAQGTSEADTQIAFDATGEKCRRGVPKWRFDSLGTCVEFIWNSEELNAFDEEQIAWEPPTKCYTRRDRQEEVPCPFNKEELNVFDGVQISMSDKPRVRCYSDLSGVEVEYQCSQDVIDRWGSNEVQKVFEEQDIALEKGCYIDPYQKVPCPFNTEDVNAFDEEQIAFEVQYGRTCVTHDANGNKRYCNTEELNAFGAEEQIAFEARRCFTAAGEVACESLSNWNVAGSDADAEFEVASELVNCRRYHTGAIFCGDVGQDEYNLQRGITASAESSEEIEVASELVNCRRYHTGAIFCGDVGQDEYNLQRGITASAESSEEIEVAAELLNCRGYRNGRIFCGDVSEEEFIIQGGKVASAESSEEIKVAAELLNCRGYSNGRIYCGEVGEEEFDWQRGIRASAEPVEEIEVAAELLNCRGYSNGRIYCGEVGEEEFDWQRGIRASLGIPEAQLAFQTPNCTQHLGRTYCGDITAEGNAAAAANVMLALDKPQCIWQGYTVNCDSLSPGTVTTIADSNPYTQDANPADVNDATSQHLLAGSDSDYELQLTK